MTTLISGVLKIVILIVALLALEEGRQERKDAAAARAETLKILSLCTASADAEDDLRYRAEETVGAPDGRLPESELTSEQRERKYNSDVTNKSAFGAEVKQ